MALHFHSQTYPTYELALSFSKWMLKERKIMTQLERTGPNEWTVSWNQVAK